MASDQMAQVVHTPGASLVQRGSTDTPEEMLIESDEFTDFSKFVVKLRALDSDWEHFREKAKENRKTRDVEMSIETLRREGTLDEDETMIPVRTIDVNITRDLPPYINYIKNSRRVCIFTCISVPDTSTDKLELEFTRGMTYPAWENSFYKALDGSETHGWDAQEVVFDKSKPFNCAVEHIGFDRLFWPRTTIDIQQAPFIIREYDFTLMELRRFVRTFGWDAKQVNKIISGHKDGKKSSETQKVYKVFYKEDDIVYSAWFSLTDGTDDWLKAPSQHYLGIDTPQGQDPQTGETDWKPEPLTQYPVFVLPYRESEKHKMVEKHGRCFLDNAKQEAQTAIMSAYVNGLTRATRIMASPLQDDGSGNSVKELANTPLNGGVILDKPVAFYNAPYPDAQILKALQYFDTANAQETSQVNFAVMNREDSRKTAKEVTLAEQQNNLLNSVQLMLFSTHVRLVYGLVWKVVQSQALQGNIRFLLINQPKPQINPATGQPIVDPNTGQPMTQDNWVNNMELIKQEYDVRAAGDVDVIQKNERVQQMKQDWPVIQNTAASTTFLCDMIRLSYPDKGEEYANLIQQGEMNKVKTLSELITGFTKVTESMMKTHPEVIGSLDPHAQLQLANMINSGNQVAQQSGMKPQQAPNAPEIPKPQPQAQR